MNGGLLDGGFKDNNYVNGILSAFLYYPAVNIFIMDGLILANRYKKNSIWLIYNKCIV